MDIKFKVKKIITWINRNKKWVFGGFGTTIILIIVNILFLPHKEYKTVIDGDVIINQNKTTTPVFSEDDVQQVEIFPKGIEKETIAQLKHKKKSKPEKEKLIPNINSDENSNQIRTHKMQAKRMRWGNLWNEYLWN